MDTHDNASLYQQMLGDDRDEVKKGADILTKNSETFPEQRDWHDVLWAGAFLVTYALLLVAAGANSDVLSFEGNSNEVSMSIIMLMALVAALVSFVLAYGFYALVRHNAVAVIYASLLVFPCIMVAMGSVMIIVLPASAPVSLIWILMGLLCMSCVYCCYRDLIPFTADILALVAGVTQEHPITMFFSLVGAVTSWLWTALALVAVTGAYDEMEECTRPRSSESQGQIDRCHNVVVIPIYFVVTFIFVWGNQVSMNSSHTMNCGVFGQWYLGKVVQPMKALSNTLTKNLGSICFGSFVIAILRAMQYTLRLIRGESDNIVVTILVFIVEMIVSCIAGMAEAFNSYSYVQVAVRGLSFYEASVSTWALLTFSNLILIVAGNLVNTVVVFGAFACGSIGALAGIAVGLAAGAGSDGEFDAEMGIGSFAAFCFGMIVAYNTLQVMESGFKTVVVMWAEDRSRLAQLNPPLNDILLQKAGEIELLEQERKEEVAQTTPTAV